MVGITKTRSRQREIVEVLFRNGWHYLRQLLLGNNAARPELPPPEVLRRILIDLGPVYVKLGQLLSTRPDLLSDRYIQALSTLQSSVPPVNWVEIAVMLRQQLHRPVHEIFAHVSPQAVAAGSIAQVHRATLLNGREVALKIQRPGIESIVVQDTGLLKGMAKLLAATEFGRRYNAIALADEVANALRAELNFCREANYCDRLRENLSTSSWFEPDRVVVPEILWELTTEKLMVMEWLDGVPLLSASLQNASNVNPTQQEEAEPQVTERQSMTTLLFRAFFQQIFCDGFFHADPHPGNLLYVGNGRIAEEQRQIRLGWQHKMTFDSGSGQLTVVVKDRAGRPVSGLQFQGFVGRPSTERHDLRVSFSETSLHGTYVAKLDDIAPGNWIVQLEGNRMRADQAEVVYRLKERLWLKR